MSNWLGDEMQPATSPRTSKRGRDSLPPPRGPYVAHGGPMGEGPQVMYSVPPSPSKKEQLHRFAGVGVGLSSVFAEHVLSHPCLVLRRQCQVNNTSLSYHLTPFTLIPTIFHIQRHQSVMTLWKGIGSTLIVKGIGVAAESAVSEFTPLPREVTRHSSLKKIAQHLLLKGIGFLVMTPFFAASLVETVQSEIACERPGVLDVLSEGGGRLLAWSPGAQTTRLLPVWKVAGPAVLHGVLHYILTSLAQYTVVLSMRSDMLEEDEKANTSRSAERSIYETYYPELLATFTGNLLADTVLYPLETLLHRLLLQGTRTIIDNTDAAGVGVVPIITRYEGVVDALRSVLAEEGLGGLYKGFGALLLQYAVHIAILKLAKLLFERLAEDAATPAPVTPLSDLSRMQQMQAQVRGGGGGGAMGGGMGGGLGPGSPSRLRTAASAPAVGTRPVRRLSQEEWSSPVLEASRNNKGGW